MGRAFPSVSGSSWSGGSCSCSIQVGRSSSMNTQGGVDLLAPLALLFPSTRRCCLKGNRPLRQGERAPGLPEPSSPTCAIIYGGTKSLLGPGAAFRCFSLPSPAGVSDSPASARDSPVISDQIICVWALFLYFLAHDCWGSWNCSPQTRALGSPSPVAQRGRSRVCPSDVAGA